MRTFPVLCLALAFLAPAAAYGFLAVYAGDTRARADATLARVRATGRFPGANLRRMQVVRVHP